MKKKIMAKKNNNKEITNEELLDSINRSFTRVEKKMATKDDLKKVKKDLGKKIDQTKKELISQISGVQNRIDTLASDKVSYEEFGKLKVRVEKVEEKV